MRKTPAEAADGQVDAAVLQRLADVRADALHAQLRVRPFDVAPRQLRDDLLPEYGIVQGLGPFPGGVAVEDVDFDGHGAGCLFPFCGCFTLMEPSIRVPVKPRLPQFLDTSP